MFSSIRWRIALPFILLILLVMVGMGLFFSKYVERVYLDTLREKQISEAVLIASRLTPEDMSGQNSAALEQHVLELHKLLGKRVTIIDKDGMVVGESDRDPETMVDHSDRPEFIAAMANGTGSSIRFSRTIGFDMMYSASVVTSPEGEKLGVARVALPLVAIRTSISSLQRMLLTMTALAALLSLLLALFISRQISKPVLELTEAAEQLAAGQKTDQIIPSSMEEIGKLTHSFNIMSSKLQEQINTIDAERARLSAVQNRMTDGVMLVDRDGKIVSMNPAAEKMFEVKEDSAAGKSLIEVTGHYLPVEIFQRSKSTNASQDGQFETRDRKLTLLGTATPLGTILHENVLLSFQDITKLRQTETIRRDFISNVSHELRTPLASIKALTETLQDGALEDTEAANRFLSQIETEVDSMSLMVAELLELSRIESGRVPLELKAVSPGEIIAPVVERLSLQADRNGLTLTSAFDEALPKINADAVRLQQVLVNLLHNAVKYTPPGGSIQVSAREEGEFVRFAVTDTGKGIAEEEQNRIFERFYKADKSRTSSGTGLGLAIARHMVELHGGQIGVTSQQDKGSTFFFTVPKA